MSAPHVTRGVRASDAERERIVQLLQDAAAEGRLSPEEAGERQAAASAATYREDLALLVADLPATQNRIPGPRAPRTPWLLWGAMRFAFVAMLVVGFWTFWGIRLFWWPLGFVAFAFLMRPWRYRRWTPRWAP
jgi:uncharacterized protein DUF1707